MDFEPVLDTFTKCVKTDPQFIEFLKTPVRAIEFNVPVVMRNGSTQYMKGFRVQHNNLLGPCKGGIRFDQSVSMNECKNLAFWMTIKCALHNLPLGGGKGGLIVNPRLLTPVEFDDACRAYAKAIAPFVGPSIDVPAPDAGTNAHAMDIMASEFQRITGGHRSTFTGKSDAVGRGEATGYGLFLALRELAPFADSLKDRTYILQGFGNVGRGLATFLHASGMRCVGIGDHSGYYIAVGADASIPMDKLMAFTGSSLADYFGANSHDTFMEVSKDVFFTQPCDVAIPAALENQIDDVLAKRMVHTTSLILEAANGPCTPAALDIFKQHGFPVIPDFLANSGGVIVSYFEMLQNQRDVHWTLDKVRHKLETYMQRMCERVRAVCEMHNLDMRMAAMQVAYDHLYAKF